MKLPIYLDIESDSIWTEYRSELRKISNVQELKAFAQRWKNLLSDIVREDWLSEDTLANIKSSDDVEKGFKLKDQMIRESAYLKWEKAGCPIDDGVEHWLQAEKDLSNYVGMVYELVLPAKTCHAMLVAKEYTVPLNCAFIQMNGGLGEFEDA